MYLAHYQILIIASRTVLYCPPRARFQLLLLPSYASSATPARWSIRITSIMPLLDQVQKDIVEAMKAR